MPRDEKKTETRSTPLDSGTYAPKVEKTVTVWPLADKDGDGDEVWEDVRDNDGNVIDRRRKKDEEGNEIFEYAPPEGFSNRPGYDHTDNYVRVDNRGRIVRNRKREAVGIKPGHVLIEHPDGNTELHHIDSHAVYAFSKSHEKTGG